MDWVLTLIRMNSMHQRALWLLALSVIFTGLIELRQAHGQPGAARPLKPDKNLFKAFDSLLARPFVDKVTGERQRIPTGKAEEALEYYEKIAGELGFPNDEAPPTLDGLLAYFGYGALKAVDAERLASEVLMDFERLRTAVSNAPEFEAAFTAHPIKDGDLLAVRYFAPKTTDVSGSAQTRALSWRKLVRLKARPGSPAAENGASVIYWLGVAYVPLSERDPFRGHALSNQVIIAREHPTPAQNSAYWLVYGTLADGGKLTTSTETSWDAIRPDARDGKLPYHVPQSCMYCHGYSLKRPKLAYFDTDHWLDRIRPDNDFSELAESRWAVLFDAGQDPQAPQFAPAFDVFRRLNTAIATQNAAVEPDGFETRAAQNWLRLHRDSSVHVPPIKRGISGPDGVTWDASRVTDRELLPLLNRYCYRCHSSLAYHVFDKAAVVERIDDMVDRINSNDSEYRMPQDRFLSEVTKKQLSDLLKALSKEKAASQE